MIRVVAAFLICLSSLVFAQTEAGYELPDRPPSHIFDPSGWLLETDRKVLGEQLPAYSEEKKIDLFLVILPVRPPQGVDAYMKQLMQSWHVEMAAGVVLHIVGDTAGPYAIVGGEIENLVSDPDELTAISDAAMSRSRREINDRQRVLTAVDEMESELHFALAAKIRIYQGWLKRATEYYEAERDRAFYKKWGLIGAVVLSLIFALCFILWQMRPASRKVKGYLFPEVTYMPRFQAPYGAGSGIEKPLRRHRRGKEG